MVMQKWQPKVADNPGVPAMFAAYCSATSKPTRKPTPLKKSIKEVNNRPVGPSAPSMFSATNSNKAVIQSRRPGKTVIKTKEKPKAVVKKELPKRAVKQEKAAKSSSSRARPVVKKETDPLVNRKEKHNPIITIVRKKQKPLNKCYVVVPEKKNERESILDKPLATDASEVLRILREAEEDAESVSSHSFDFRVTEKDTEYHKIMQEKLKGFLGDNGDDDYDDEYDEDNYSISSYDSDTDSDDDDSCI
jgi:hypothetical protein